MKIKNIVKLLAFIFLVLVFKIQVSYAGCTNGLYSYNSSSTYTDSDEGISYADAYEIMNGSDPCIENDRYKEIDGFKVFWSTGDYIEVNIPWNLRSIDVENSGFISFDTGGSLDRFDHFMPASTDTGYWLNNSKELSRIKGRLTLGDNNSLINYSSSGVLVGSSDVSVRSYPGPHKLSSRIFTDTYHPYLFLKIVDFLNGDPEKDYSEYIYLGQMFVDITPPVCNAILHGRDHEQRTNNWDDDLGYTTGSSFFQVTSLTGVTASDISIYSGAIFSHKYETSNYNMPINRYSYYTGSFIRTMTGYLGVPIEPTTPNDPNINIFNGYTGHFIRAGSGYIPWSRDMISFINDYKDNLAGLYYAKYSILRNSSGAAYAHTGYTFDSSLAATFQDLRLGSITGTLFVHRDNPINTLPDGDSRFSNFRYKNPETNSELPNDFNNYKVHIEIFDRALNRNICSSLISKVDTTTPSIIFNDFKDFKGDSFGEAGKSEIEPNRGANIFITLRDDKTGCPVDGKGCQQRVGIDESIRSVDINDPQYYPKEGVSSFRPSDLREDETIVYYCGRGTTGSCIHNADGTMKSGAEIARYVYSATGTYSSGVFLPGGGGGDLRVPSGVYIEKDAYFIGGLVKCEGGVCTATASSTAPGYSLSELLVSKSGVFLSTETGFTRIQNGLQMPYVVDLASTGIILRSTGFVSTTYTDSWNYLSGAVLTGNIAFKIYARNNREMGISTKDKYYPIFKLRDRAGNEKIMGFDMQRRLLVKVLGNVQVKEGNYIDDKTVQEFNQNMQTLAENIAAIKNRIRYELANARMANLSQESGTVVINNGNDLKTKMTEYDIGNELIYVLRKGNVVIGNGDINLGKNKNVTIVSYGGNIIVNSKYLSSNKVLALVALTDATYTQVRLESQGNILISPNLLAIRSHLIAEGSLFSYAYVNSKIDILFTYESRRAILKNSLLIDGMMMSNNTIGGYRATSNTCPDTIYGKNNTCYIGNNTSDSNKRVALSLMYDLHYLRLYFKDEEVAFVANPPELALDSYHPISKAKSGFAAIGGNYFATPLPGKFSLFTDPNPSANFVDIKARLREYSDFPVIIRNVVPDYSMKIFGNNNL